MKLTTRAEIDYITIQILLSAPETADFVDKSKLIKKSSQYHYFPFEVLMKCKSKPQISETKIILMSFPEKEYNTHIYRSQNKKNFDVLYNYLRLLYE